MPLARARAVGLVGLTGHVVEVEAHLSSGLPSFTLVGLPDTALSEARDRVRAAVLNSREEFPARRITVGLSPAALPKRGSAYDLALACAVLAGAGAVPQAALEHVVLLGELGLDGSVRAVRGVLPCVLAAASAGAEVVVVPSANADEARLVPGVEVVDVRSLSALLARLRGEVVDAEPSVPSSPSAAEGVTRGGEGRVGGLSRGAVPTTPDLADVLGQVEARFALEVAAAGGHHLFMLGPPGVGKTMLAERLPGLLPPLDLDAALDVTAVHSVAGTLPAEQPLVDRPPFANPHHTATVPALVGGGSGLARPGAVSLAHRGVLFLDEAPEFPRRALDALRQPLESGEVVLARADGTVRFPARFTLVLAANPCACAGTQGVTCACSALARRRYLARLSGPLLDRVDLQVTLRQVSRVDMRADRDTVESSDVVRPRVRAARERATARLLGTPWRTNAEVPPRELRGALAPQPSAVRLVDEAMRRGRLSARGVDKVLRVAWTVADLRAHSRPGVDDVAEALSLRAGRSAGVAA